MTDPMIPSTPEENDDLLAAEYVLGVLDLPDRAMAEARLRTDSTFQARVATWETRLEGLNDEFTDAPAPDLLPAIEARLFPKAPARATNWFTRAFGLALATATAAAVVAFLLLSPPAPSFTATLTADAGPLRYEATVVGDTITLAQIGGEPTEPGKVRELWLIIGDHAPVSLGLLTAQTVSLPAVAPGEGVVLAISLEPEGGSPTGAPTGPVLVVGTLAAT
jgi:anti-sigma-K factor RskA